MEKIFKHSYKNASSVVTRYFGLAVLNSWVLSFFLLMGLFGIWFIYNKLKVLKT